MVTGRVSSHLADAVMLATGGYANVFYLSTNAKGCNTTAIWRAHRRGAYFANPCYTQIHPTCIPVHGANQSKLTLMSESLRNDGRIWVPLKKGETRKAPTFRSRARLLPRAQVPELREPRPPRHLLARGQAGLRRGARRRAGRPGRLPRLRRVDRPLGEGTIRERYGNLFEMYERITDENRTRSRCGSTRRPLRDGRPVGRLQPHVEPPGALRPRRGEFLRPRREPLGASALMQGLADGYFVIPYTIGNYLAQGSPRRSTPLIRR